MSVPRQPHYQPKPHLSSARQHKTHPSSRSQLYQFQFFNASSCTTDGTTTGLPMQISKRSSVSLHLLNVARIKWHSRLARSESDASMGTCYLQLESGDGKVTRCDTRLDMRDPSVKKRRQSGSVHRGYSRVQVKGHKANGPS